MSYVAIASAIKTILEGITEIKIVYDHEPKELKKYPAATVSALEHENIFHDTAANKRRYGFIIRLYYRTEDAQKAEQNLRTVADAIISAIEADVTLGGVCDWAEPSKGKWAYQDREVPVRVCEITIEANKRVVR